MPFCDVLCLQNKIESMIVVLLDRTEEDIAEVNVTFYSGSLCCIECAEK